ncbi:Ribonuclease BN-like family protein [Corynebacterium faecale]|uniref:YihY/virulence factor BrkB family protein n=1 Tax=Corynebacterium faecale TaxID=1758466 RepID=UPI0025B52213|nr:YihY/virulence factor BrkB family protein [Corynebacterium faecale]WJY91695.1 Ribonuclease BN-like family protein [Corynebacterium faecale]
MVQPSEYLNATLIAADTDTSGREINVDKLRPLSSAGWRLAIKRVAWEFYTERLWDLGALLTYFSVLSLAPALLVSYSLITLILASGPLEVLDRTRSVIDQYIAEEQRDIVLSVVDAVAGSASAGRVGLIVGIVVALWTSSAYVRAFSRCANTVYGRAEGRFLLKHWLMMVLMNLSLLLGAVLILVSLVINETIVMRLVGPLAEPLRLTDVLTYLTDTFIPVWNWVKWPVILVVLMVLVAMLYHIAPNVKPSRFKWLSAGSIFAILGILFAGWCLSIYFDRFASFNTYGAVGSVMALFVGMWILNIVLIVGLKIDAEVSRARQLQAGLPAEENNLVPPRSITAALRNKQNYEKTVEQARQFRLKHVAENLAEDNEPEESDESARQGAHRVVWASEE